MPFHERLTPEQVKVIQTGFNVGNGIGAFFLRPILKTAFGCVWSRDYTCWYAPTKETHEKATLICTIFEKTLADNLTTTEMTLISSLLPNRDRPK